MKNRKIAIFAIASAIFFSCGTQKITQSSDTQRKRKEMTLTISYPKGWTVSHTDDSDSSALRKIKQYEDSIAKLKNL